MLVFSLNISAYTLLISMVKFESLKGKAAQLSRLERLFRIRSQISTCVGSSPAACRKTSNKKLMLALCVSVPHRCVQCRCECSWKLLRPSERMQMLVPCIGESQPTCMHVKTNTLFVKEQGVHPVYCTCQFPAKNSIVR